MRYIGLSFVLSVLLLGGCQGVAAGDLLTSPGGHSRSEPTQHAGYLVAISGDQKRTLKELLDIARDERGYAQLVAFRALLAETDHLDSPLVTQELVDAVAMHAVRVCRGPGVVEVCPAKGSFFPTPSGREDLRDILRGDADAWYDRPIDAAFAVVVDGMRIPVLTSSVGTGPTYWKFTKPRIEVDGTMVYQDLSEHSHARSVYLPMRKLFDNDPKRITGKHTYRCTVEVRAPNGMTATAVGTFTLEVDDRLE